MEKEIALLDDLRTFFFKHFLIASSNITLFMLWIFLWTMRLYPSQNVVVVGSLLKI